MLTLNTQKEVGIFSGQVGCDSKHQVRFTDVPVDIGAAATSNGSYKPSDTHYGVALAIWRRPLVFSDELQKPHDGNLTA